MDVIIAFFVGALCGGVTMTLVYRNNIRRIEATIAKMQEAIDGMKK